jgi:cysteine desulfurase
LSVRGMAYQKRLPTTPFISFFGYSVESVRSVLADVTVSTGSACHSGSTAISPILKAMNVLSEEVSTTIRFSLGKYTTEDEIDAVLTKLKALSDDNQY